MAHCGLAPGNICAHSHAHMPSARGLARDSEPPAQSCKSHPQVGKGDSHACCRQSTALVAISVHMWLCWCMHSSGTVQRRCLGTLQGAVQVQLCGHVVCYEAQ